MNVFQSMKWIFIILQRKTQNATIHSLPLSTNICIRFGFIGNSSRWNSDTYKSYHFIYLASSSIEYANNKRELYNPDFGKKWSRIQTGQPSVNKWMTRETKRSTIHLFWWMMLRENLHNANRLGNGKCSDCLQNDERTDRTLAVNFARVVMHPSVQFSFLARKLAFFVRMTQSVTEVSIEMQNTINH